MNQVEERCPTCGSREPAWPYPRPLTADEQKALDPCLDAWHDPQPTATPGRAGTERYETTVHDKRTGQPVAGCEGNAIAERDAALARVSGLEEFQSVSRNEARTLADLAEAQDERDQLREERDEWVGKYLREATRLDAAERRQRELEGAIEEHRNKAPKRYEAPLRPDGQDLYGVQPVERDDKLYRALQPAPSTQPTRPERCEAVDTVGCCVLPKDHAGQHDHGTQPTPQTCPSCGSKDPGWCGFGNGHPLSEDQGEPCCLDPFHQPTQDPG